MTPSITYIIDNLKMGGAQTQLSRLIKGLAKKDFDINVICLGDADANLVDQIEKHKITFLPMKCVWTIQFWTNFYSMIKRLQTLKPSIVHTYLNTSNVFGTWAAKKANVPVIVTSRRDMGHFRSKRIAAMEKWSNRFCHKVVCVSNAVKEKTLQEEQLPKEKIVVLYGGVDSEQFKRPLGTKNESVLSVGMVATMDRPMKGHMDFLHAAKLIQDHSHPVQIMLVGEGSLRRELEEFVQSNNMTNMVHFKGQSNDVIQEMNGLDILVLPSHSEGFSNAVLEAMSMEIPVLANAIEGNLEIIDNGINGILIEPRNVQHMANEIIKFINRKAELKEMGQKARQKILDHFTIDHMVNRYKQFYQQLLAV
ncbi:MAG: glycosyltransferase [Candidatus Omnitrophica bacterium]|nr:glycosyltransferase [Candidatus Omnitrophota bacterium]